MMMMCVEVGQSVSQSQNIQTDDYLLFLYLDPFLLSHRTQRETHIENNLNWMC